MELLYLILLLFLVVVIFGVVGVSIVFIYFTISSGFMHSSPPVPSSGKVKEAMLADAVSYLTKQHQKQTIMDLGSGWGSLLLPLAKQFPEHTFIGIEYGYIPYIVSCLRAKKLKNIQFIRQDFFTSDISRADVIFLFLLTSTMAKLSAKCIAEAKHNAIAYVNRFPLQNKKPVKTVSFGSDYETYYVYKF